MDSVCVRWKPTFIDLFPVGKIWRRLQEVFIEDFLKTSSRSLHWRLLEDVFTPLGTPSGLPSIRLQDRCRRLQNVFMEDFLETSSHLWEPLRTLTRGRLQGYLQGASKTCTDVLMACLGSGCRKRLQNSAICTDACRTSWKRRFEIHVDTFRRSSTSRSPQVVMAPCF